MLARRKLADVISPAKLGEGGFIDL